MILELKIYQYFCATKVFRINGVDADADDFGNHYDRDPSNAEDYCCGNMRFTRKSPTQDVLNKYFINESEYAQIAERLEDELTWGSCGLCS